MTSVMEHCDHKGLEHCDERSWIILISRSMEHCDDKGMKQCDPKVHGGL